MAATHMIVEPGYEDDVFGIAISSPGLCSPGLMGDQGWSPCSSVYDESFEVPVLATALIKSRRHSMAWPVPPIRVPATRPLSFSKERQRPSSSASSSGSSAMSESSAATLPDGVALPHASPLVVMKRGKVQSEGRRYVSMPMPMKTTEAHVGLLDAFVDDVRVVGSSNDEEAFDETLPLMPEQHLADWHDADEQERVKMERLQASFSLLGVERGPRAGYYSPTSSDGGGNESGCPSATGATGHTGENSPVDGAASYSPTAGLCLLRMALSPEHKAPTLAEQMAFATGLGAMCAWASPMRFSYASSPSTYSPYQLPSIQTVRSMPLSASLTTVDQNERQHASRHIRQNVAASAALSRSQFMMSDSMDAEYQEAVTKQGDHEAMVIEEHEDVAEGYSEADFHRDMFERRLLHRTSMSDSVGHHSLAASMSSGEGPIMSGDFEAAAFEEKTKELSTAQTSDAGQSYIQASVASDSPALPEAFSHLALSHQEAFFASQQEEAQREEERVVVVRPPTKTFYPDANGFNGNTFSPHLTTPELGLQHTPRIMDCGPSPYMWYDSIHGTQPFQAADRFDASSHSATSKLSSSSSAMSIMERSRPLPSRSVSSGLAGFFKQQVELEAAKKRAAKKASVAESPTTPPDNVPVTIPQRKASLNLDTMMKPSVIQPSVSFKDEPHPRYASSSSPSSSATRALSNLATGSLSPEALSQVREACRAKASILRKGD